jgi:hypothetical protein
MPDNRGDIVKVLPSTDPNTRVVIVKRPDGYFAIRPEQWRARVHDANLGIAARWMPLNRVSGIFASVELAEKEALVEYPWISRTSN